MLPTDTPVPTFPRSRLDDVKSLIGDLARPFALISLSLTSAIAVLHPGVTPEKLGVALAALAAMYGAKAWEAHGVAKAQASVETAKVAASPAPANDPVPPSVIPAGDPPPWERAA